MNAARSVWDASCGDRWAIVAPRWPRCSLSADMLLHSQGSRLALGGHHCRNPAGGKWLVRCARPFHLLRVYAAGVHLSEPEW